jgi:hypothetical protein
MNIGHIIILVAISLFLLGVLPAIINAAHNHPEWRDTRDSERAEEIKKLVVLEHLDYEKAAQLAREKYPEKLSDAYIQHLVKTVLITMVWLGFLWFGLELANR